MSLATDVQSQIRRFVVGFVSADDLSDWLDVNAQAIHDADNSNLRRLTDTAFSLLEDIFQGRRSEEDGRTALSMLVAPAQTYVHSATGWGSTTTATSTVSSVVGSLNFQMTWPVEGMRTESGALLSH